MGAIAVDSRLPSEPAAPLYSSPEDKRKRPPGKTTYKVKLREFHTHAFGIYSSFQMFLFLFLTQKLKQKEEKKSHSVDGALLGDGGHRRKTRETENKHMKASPPPPPREHFPRESLPSLSLRSF